MLPQYMALCVSLFRPKTFYATSKQGRRVRFDMSTASWKTTFVGSLHAAYSALRYFLCREGGLIGGTGYERGDLCNSRLN